MTARMSGPSHGSGVRPGRLPGDAPVSRREPGLVGHRGRGGAQLCGVGIARGQDPLGKAVGGEQRLVRAGRAASCGAHGGGQEVDVGRLQVPAAHAAHGDAGPLAGRLGPLEVLADGEGRVVGREDQARRCARTPASRQRLDAVLDARRGVLQPERDVEAAGLARLQRALERSAAAPRCAGPGARGRRSPRSGRPGRPAAPASAGGPRGCRCSTARSRRARGRAVGHQEDAGAGGAGAAHRRSPRGPWRPPAPGRRGRSRAGRRGPG